MKRIFALVLTTTFAFNILGIFFLLEIQQIRIRHEITQQIKQGIPTGKLFKITITADNEHLLCWKKDKEFSYEGILYDVVKEIISNETTIEYYCLTDTQETLLFSKLDDQLKKNSEHSKNSNKPLSAVIKLLTNLYYHPLKNSIPNLLSRSGFTRCELTNTYISPFLAISSPPPKAILS